MLAIALDAETNEELVVYATIGRGKRVFVRTVAAFMGQTEHGAPRFTRVP